MTRSAIKTIWTKNGRVISPRDRLEVMPWPVPAEGWRLALLLDENKEVVTISSRDLRSRTVPVTAD